MKIGKWDIGINRRFFFNW